MARVNRSYINLAGRDKDEIFYLEYEPLSRDELQNMLKAQRLETGVDFGTGAIRVTFPDPPSPGHSDGE